MAASRACTEPSGITCMPSRPQPCWRASSRLSQSVSEPPVVTPMRLPLRSAMVLIGDLASTTTREVRRRAVHRRHADRRHALGAEAEARAGAERDVDRAGGEAGLHLRVALEARNRELDAFLLEDAGLHADVGRGRTPRNWGPTCRCGACPAPAPEPLASNAAASSDRSNRPLIGNREHKYASQGVRAAGRQARRRFLNFARL